MQADDHGYQIAAMASWLLLAASIVGGCAAAPPYADFPRKTSVALERPQDTELGRRFASQAREHAHASGYRLINVGLDGFRARVELIKAAQKTLDLQYYIFRGDETGRLLTDEMCRAAERGVRIRVLVDDGDTEPGDEQLLRLAAYPTAEIRIFNPYPYRGHSHLLRNLTFLLHKAQLDYRMHNKLMVADGSVALIGGRNIGNEYFQVDPQSQFADEDTFVAGPMVGQLSHEFDQFWNSDLAIPSAAFDGANRGDTGEEARAGHERDSDRAATRRAAGIDYAALLAQGGPYSGITAGHVPLVWASAELVYDSPDKKQVEQGDRRGRLIVGPVLSAADEVRSELLMISPFFVPSPDELALLQSLRGRQVAVRILTNSLESNPQIAAQAGYGQFRVPLLQAGAQLYEIRPLLGDARGSGETRRMSRYGHYALHGKMYVFDRRRLFVGSMNFDQRSERINTEIGLIIESAELAQQTAARFDQMVKPEDCFQVELSPSSAGHAPKLEWHTRQDGAEVVYTREPARSGWQRFKDTLLAWLPIEREL